MRSIFCRRRRVYPGLRDRLLDCGPHAAINVFDLDPTFPGFLVGQHANLLRAQRHVSQSQSPLDHGPQPGIVVAFLAGR
jgi:hypothetical protein